MLFVRGAHAHVGLLGGCSVWKADVRCSDIFNICYKYNVCVCVGNPILYMYCYLKGLRPTAGRRPGRGGGRERFREIREVPLLS